MFAIATLVFVSHIQPQISDNVLQGPSFYSLFICVGIVFVTSYLLDPVLQESCECCYSFRIRPLLP